MGIPVPSTLLAFDDTDSPDGMCTTYLATLLIDDLSDFDLLGLPRLVRLNPNVPWKTRGNAAISLSLGEAKGSGTVCGNIRGESIKVYSRGSQVDPEDVLERSRKVLERVAMFDCPKTNPGIVSSNRRPPPSLYWRTVREVVSLKSVESVLGKTGAAWRKYKSGRGVIGAAAAMSWRPRDRTWEVIAYRDASKIGLKRAIDPESVIRMDKSTKWTFNNYDYENQHMAIAPSSPCPILFGIRGDSQSELLKARTMIKGEEPDRWLLFLTNQGTEDHLVDRRISGLRPWESARVAAMVCSEPVTIQGGHVIVRVTDGHEIDAAFYEPSRGFRDVGRALLPGDEVLLCGSVRDEPRSLNVEKMMVRKLVRDVRKVSNPICRKCRKSMGSMGSNQGYRCKKCGAKAPATKALTKELPRAIKVGWYEPPVASRRHLHKPLRRMSRGNIDNL